jgi:excinuclease ABC subunit B
MARAVAETERRRAKQMAYNAEHGIVPRTIRKEVRDILEGARSSGRAPGRGHRVAEPAIDYAKSSPEQILRRIGKLEKRMHEYARNLEFEQAAELRDEIAGLREAALGLPASRRAG